LAAQRSAEIAGHNIANLHTPGYTRQVAVLTARAHGHEGRFGIGQGVDLERILRVEDAFLADRLRMQEAAVGKGDVRASILAEIEAMLQEPSEHGVNGAMGRFFASLGELSNRPGDLSARALVVSAAQDLASSIRELSGRLRRISEGLRGQIESKLETANSLLSDVAMLNDRIEAQRTAVHESSDLLDARTEKLRQLSAVLGATVHDESGGAVSVWAGGQRVLFRNGYATLRLLEGADATVVADYSGKSLDLDIQTGEIGGLLELRNDTLPGYSNSLDTFAQTLINEVNAIHAAGVGLTGGSGSLTAEYAVQDIDGSGTPDDDVLADAGLTWPPESGSVYLTVRELSTGSTQRYQIDIDPSVDSLADVAARISALSHLEATASDGRLRIVAEPGFDMRASTPYDPTPGSLGASAVAVSGEYRGAANGTITLAVQGSGDVGSSDGLYVQVTDAEGTVVGAYDVGSGYVPGESIVIADGLSISLSSGAVSDGDTLSFEVLAQNDTAGLFSALGLNAFFVGDGAGSIDVQPEIVEAPSRISGAVYSSAYDNTNILKLVELQDRLVMEDGSRTLGEHYGRLVGRIGLDTARAKNHHEAQGLVLTSLQNQRDSVSGVSLEEELFALMRAQQAFQASAKYVSVISDILDKLSAI